MLAWLANGPHGAQPPTSSMTRGDGGPEPDRLRHRRTAGRDSHLGAAGRPAYRRCPAVLRRALDFGFSKGPGETLEIWGTGPDPLRRSVFVIRRYRPDVIIARVRHRRQAPANMATTPPPAILAEEAFAAAADSTRFPEQLTLGAARGRRSGWCRNAGRIRATRRPRHDAGRVAVDLGAFNAAARALVHRARGREPQRAHKTQGFGSAERRGSTGRRLRAQGWRARDQGPVRRREPHLVARAGRRRAQRVFTAGGARVRSERPQAIVPLLLKAHAILAGLRGRSARWCASARSCWT